MNQPIGHSYLLSLIDVKIVVYSSMKEQHSMILSPFFFLQRGHKTRPRANPLFPRGDAQRGKKVSLLSHSKRKALLTTSSASKPPCGSNKPARPRHAHDHAGKPPPIRRSTFFQITLHTPCKWRITRAQDKLFNNGQFPATSSIAVQIFSLTVTLLKLLLKFYK